MNAGIILDSTDQSGVLETPDTTFKVQISASAKRLALKAYNFKGLKDLSREKNGRIWRYFYGETSDYNQATQMREKAVALGYSGAFVVAYRDGNRIAIQTALETS